MDVTTWASPWEWGLFLSVASGGFFCNAEDGHSEIIYITLSSYYNYHLQLTQVIFLIYRALTLRYAHVAPLGLWRICVSRTL